jgi:hypothetical protein
VRIKSRSGSLVYFLLKYHREDPDGEDDERTIRIIPCRGAFLDA